ncbi:hypothetical protein G9A89_017156 [Geosiphon pyriformis]|nr:hypothetical protein G9A89_017156 [Geosiphon pyriformis]
MVKHSEISNNLSTFKKIINLTINIAAFFPVVFVIALLAWSYYAFVYRLCVLYLLTVKPIQGIIYLLFYHPIFILTAWSYLKAVFTSPGSPSDPSPELSNIRHQTSSYIPIPQHQSHSLEIPSNNEASIDAGQIQNTPNLNLTSDGSSIPLGTITVKQNGEKRFCKKCQNFKPDRTHHCRICKRCILKMDHHCPWLNNCIGYQNQKFFYLFILWATIYSYFLMFATMPPTFQFTGSTYEGILDLDTNWSFLILVGAIFALCLSGFAAYHTSLIFSNQTTLESLQRQNFKVKEEEGVIMSKYLNLFDVGKRANFMQVMGPVWYLWFIPVGNSLGDGRSWPLNSYRYGTLCEPVEGLNPNHAV